MSRQNRVTPYGEIVAVSAKGTLMGNRGCLHDDAGRIVRQSQRKAWIYCLLDFKGTKRTVMAPGNYTELFFLDEATALAAGHRPCSECQRSRYKEFVARWTKGNRALLQGKSATAALIDGVLHRERLQAGNSKVTQKMSLNKLPDGCMVALPDSPTVYLVHGAQLLPWSFEGYGKPRVRSPDASVEVLTPSSVVNAIGAGFDSAWAVQFL